MAIIFAKMQDMVAVWGKGGHQRTLIVDLELAALIIMQGIFPYIKVVFDAL